MTQYGGYFDALNSQIVANDNKSKFKIAIRRLRLANVIDPVTNQLNLEAFVTFISNMDNHTNASGVVANTNADLFSLENLINILYNYYNPLININNIGNPNYILLDENNNYIHSPILERNPINTRESLKDARNNPISIIKYRLTQNFRLEKIQLNSKDISDRIAFRKRGAPYVNTGQGQMETDYDESHHLYQDYLEDIKMKSTLVNVLSTDYGNIGDLNFDIIQDYNNISIVDIIKVKLLESHMLMNDKFLSKIRETHTQKVLVELFNQLFNPLNLPTKHYNPINTMIETNTMDKFFGIIHSSNGLSPTPEGIARDIRINRTPGEQTITQLFDTIDMNTFQNEISLIITRFVEIINADVANRESNYGMCNLMNYIDRLEQPLNQNIIGILRMIINLFGPELIKVAKFDAFNEFNVKFTKIRKITIFQTIKDTITKYIYINRKDKEVNNTITADIDAYYTRMNNGDLLGNIFSTIFNNVTGQELNIRNFKPFIGVLNSIRTEPHVTNVIIVKKLFNFIVGISKIKEMEIYYRNDIRIINRIIEKLAIIISLFIDIVNDVQDRTILEGKLVRLDIPQDVITDIIDTTNTTATGTGNARAQQTEKNNKIVARLARVINEFFERLNIEDIQDNRNVDNYIEQYKNILREMLHRENMLFESIDRQLLALIENNATIDIIYNRFETNQQCYQPLQNNTNITLCDAFINENILNGILENLNTNRADFNLNPDMNLRDYISGKYKIFSRIPDNERIRFGDEYKFDINQPITQPVLDVPNNLSIGQTDINTIINQPIYHNMLYFIKQLTILTFYIYKTDKLLDTADNFGTGIGSMLAYINFNLILKNPTLYVNKRSLLAKIFGIPIGNINTITQKVIRPDNLPAVQAAIRDIRRNNYFSLYNDELISVDRIRTTVAQYGYNSRAEFNSRFGLISDLIFKMVEGSRVAYNRIVYSYPFEYFPDCIETGIRNFINLMIFKSNILNQSLLPESTFQPVREYYNRFVTLEQHRDIIAHEEWFKIFNIQLREIIRRRLPNLELEMWPNINQNNTRIHPVTINGVNYNNFADMNGGGIFFTIALLIFLYGDSDDLFEEISRLNLNNNNAESKRWVISKLDRIIKTQFPKLALKEEDSQYSITMDGVMHGTRDVLFIRIFNMRHYTHTGHSDIDYEGAQRNPEENLDLHNINTILNVAYPNIHKILLMRHLHINKRPNYNDILARSIMPERITIQGVANILQTILDPRYGGTYNFFTGIFNRDNQPADFSVDRFGNYNKIQLMTKLLYSYNSEVKYYIENVILYYCSLILNPGQLTIDKIQEIRAIDMFFSENGFSNLFINKLGVALHTEANTTYEYITNTIEAIPINNLERRINSSNSIAFLKIMPLFRNCITDMFLNKELFDSLIFEEQQLNHSTVNGRADNIFCKNLNKLIFIKVFAHYCLSDNKLDNFSKFMDILITTNINNNTIECLINNFWIFYYNNTQNNNNAKLNKIIFDRFIDKLSRYSGNSTVNINMIKLLFSVQTDILYNNTKIFNLRNLDQLSIIFDIPTISDRIKSLIVFTDPVKGEYFQGKDMVYEIAENMIEGIITGDKREFLLSRLNTVDFYQNPNPISDKINLKLALIQKEYLEVVLRRLINRKFIFYNNNKDIIIEHITNFFEKKPENRFIIDLHSMMQFDILNTETSMNIFILLVLNMTNPFILHLMAKYPKENYIRMVAVFQANPRNIPINSRNIIESLPILPRLRNPLTINDIYISTIESIVTTNERTKRPYTTTLQEIITANNRNPLGRQVQTILTYYTGNADNTQNGGYYKKYLKYKEKYIKLSNALNRA